MKRVLPTIAVASIIALFGCSQNVDQFDPPQITSGGEPSLQESVPDRPFSFGPLPVFFDCVRENGGMLVASHRGGPAPGYPENALETLQFATSRGIVIHEIDVAESQDGVLFLMHDRTLGRTTTGGGFVAATDWDEIASLNLKDNTGKVTPYVPPKLSEVLLWARDAGVIVELDKKETTSFRNIIGHVRAADAENNVILITYNDDAAKEVARLAPDLMMTASIDSRSHQSELERGGIDLDNVIAWMGTRNPNPRAFEAIGARGVETAFGTLGRAGERLDDQYIADGDLSEYRDLADAGLTLLATDEAYLVADYLNEDDKAIATCGQR